MSAAWGRRPLATLRAWEAVTSLGESAVETALFLRAGLNNVTVSRFIDATGQRVMLCGAPALPPDLGGVERAAALAQLALAGLAESSWVPPRRHGASWRPILLLALPERYAAGESTSRLGAEGRSFLDALRVALPQALEGTEIEVFPFGRAAGAVALRRAIELAQDERLVIWGGVDTLYDWSALEALETADRLITVENVDGVRPGEGAAFLVLGPAKQREAIGILGFGIGQEPCPVGSEKPCHSIGLTAALETAVEPLRAARSRSNCWLLDNSHEVYATQELQNIIARFGDVLGLQTELQMPLQELGDVGAAAMPLLAVMGAEAWRLGYANDTTAVITACSERGTRGALLLAAPGDFRPVEMVA